MSFVFVRELLFKSQFSLPTVNSSFKFRLFGSCVTCSYLLRHRHMGSGD